MVGGQFEHRLAAVELGAPVVPQHPAARGVEQRALPVGELRVAGGGRRGQHGVAAGLPRVQPAELVGHDGDRPHVDSDVVHDDRQDVPARPAEQHDLEDPSLGEREQLAPDLVAQPLAQLPVVQVRRVLDGERHVLVVQHLLVRIPVLAPVQGGAQCGVPVDERLEGAAQRFDVHVGEQLECDVDVLGGAVRVLPFQDPQRLLVERERAGSAVPLGG